MKALIRADASVQIGMGHRVRCQALISAFQALGWQCQFVVHRSCCAFSESNDVHIDDEQAFLTLAAEADLVVLDHYQYQASDIQRLYQHQPNLLVLDDMNDRGVFPARWVLNPLHEEYSNLILEPLTGPRFALLRPEFSTFDQTLYQPEKLLITLGGTDPLTLTLPILKSLQRHEFPLEKIHVLLGENAANAEAVKAFSAEHKVNISKGLAEVTPLMGQAKLAISAAGGTLFELASMGVPTIFAQVADNQTRSLEQHVPLGWCKSVRLENVSSAQRAQQVEKLVYQAQQLWFDLSWLTESRRVAMSLVDSNGADRVANVVTNGLVG
ncbi:UDP-2,4-diacetamido-2,4,6-trideoxy-beta-L-altropyranose hydrolase [Marinomonas sp. TI.3.20]|uniref:UDP-2,4-diacetamido-2,4, 6-trideoxy-beta-L-altropyranose hydrolase n=1 Tax=Marinomonas sp. TI.3.20 TaxID=3121296 RepID=UPI00311E7DFC